MLTSVLLGNHSMKPGFTPPHHAFGIIHLDEVPLLPQRAPKSHPPGQKE